MKKNDIELANKLNSDLSMAIEAGTTMTNKMKNSSLKKYLQSHIEKYEGLRNELKSIVSTSNKKLKNTNLIARAFSWMQIQLSSFKKNEESDYVESFIKGSEMGIESSNELLAKYSEADNSIKDIVIDLQTIELENIDKLKDYLKRSDYL
jgi:hypothetical protein